MTQTVPQSGTWQGALDSLLLEVGPVGPAVRPSLRYGIEIECFIPKSFVSSGQFEVGSHYQGVQIKGAPEGWRAAADASVGPHAPRDYVGLEIVSPILHGERGLGEIVGFLDFLKEIGAEMSQRTGMHVHVDAKSLTEYQVEQVKMAFIYFEEAFFGLNGEHYSERSVNPYCWPSDYWQGKGRYCSLNWQPYHSRKKTLECRTWRATLEAEVAVAAVVMFTALVAKVAAGQHTLTSTAGKSGWPPEASEHFVRAYLEGGYSFVEDPAFNDEVGQVIVSQSLRTNVEVG